MENLEKLYDAFGELVYVVAMADGIIQKEEYDKLEQMLSDHPWGKEIKWSFDYEKSHGNSVDDLYKKVLDQCYEEGPRKEYNFLLELINQVANASSGVDEKENEVIEGFTSELMERFRKDLDKIK